MKLTKIFFVATIAGLLNTAIIANPDVFFADSANYQDAYLTHEFDADNIKFKMSNDVVNIAMPAQSYNFDALVSFTSNEYQFQNPALKADFVKMFDMSFETSFDTMVFLNELLRLLQHFTVGHPEHVH